MKKSLALVCVLVILATVLCGCKKDPDLKVFNIWITDNGFTPGMNAKSMLYKITTYTFLGKNLTPDGEFNDDLGEGYSAGSSFWGMNNNTTTKNGTVHAYSHFYVRKNLDNLQFPGGVKIGDSREDCLEKLDLTDKKTNVKDIRIGNKICEMSVSDSHLLYTENYDWLDSRDKTVKVTRTLILKFSGDSLDEVGVTVSEKFPE